MSRERPITLADVRRASSVYVKLPVEPYWRDEDELPDQEAEAYPPVKGGEKPPLESDPDMPYPSLVRMLRAADRSRWSGLLSRGAPERDQLRFNGRGDSPRAVPEGPLRCSHRSRAEPCPRHRHRGRSVRREAKATGANRRLSARRIPHAGSKGKGEPRTRHARATG